MYLRLLDICNKNEPQQAWISIKTKGKQLVFVARQLQLKTQLNPTGRFSHVFSATQLHLALRSCSASCVACIMARCFQGLARHSGSISLRMFTSFTSSCFFFLQLRSNLCLCQVSFSWISRRRMVEGTHQKEGICIRVCATALI